MLLPPGPEEEWMKPTRRNSRLPYSHHHLSWKVQPFIQPLITRLISCHSVCFHFILRLLFSVAHVSRNGICSFQSYPPASTLTSHSVCPPYWLHICLIFPPSPLSGGSDLTISFLPHFLFRWRGGVWVLPFHLNYTVKLSLLSCFVITRLQHTGLSHYILPAEFVLSTNALLV